MKKLLLLLTLFALAPIQFTHCSALKDELTELEDTYRSYMRKIQEKYCVETSKQYNALDCRGLRIYLRQFAAELEITCARKNLSPEDAEQHRQLLINRINIISSWLSDTP